MNNTNKSKLEYFLLKMVVDFNQWKWKNIIYTNFYLGQSGDSEILNINILYGKIYKL